MLTATEKLVVLGDVTLPAVEARPPPPAPPPNPRRPARHCLDDNTYWAFKWQTGARTTLHMRQRNTAAERGDLASLAGAVDGGGTDVSSTHALRYDG